MGYWGIAILWVASHISMHDIHLSKMDIHYKTEQKALQITVHMFLDDTEAALCLRDSLEYKLFETLEHPLADSLLAEYLFDNLEISVDGLQVPLTYLGKEQSEDLQAVYAYLEIENTSVEQEIIVKNTVLLELFDDQRNMISVKENNKRKAFHLFSHKENTATIDF